MHGGTCVESIKKLLTACIPMAWRSASRQRMKSCSVSVCRTQTALAPPCGVSVRQSFLPYLESGIAISNTLTLRKSIDPLTPLNRPASKYTSCLLVSIKRRSFHATNMPVPRFIIVPSRSSSSSSSGSHGWAMLDEDVIDATIPSIAQNAIELTTAPLMP